METTSTLQKNNTLKLTRVLMFLAFLCLGLKANAQCSAGYTIVVDPTNNGDVAFTNTSTGSMTYYYWDFGDGQYSNLANPGTHTYASTGTYTACLQVYDSLGLFDSTLGCYNTFCSPISIINTSSAGPCTASFIPYDSLGYGYFYNTSTGTGLTSSWSFGDGSFATGSGDITHSYAASGTYNVCLTISNFLGTCSSTYCDSITIGAAGPCNAFFGAVDSVSFTQFYDASTSSGVLNYSWDFGDGVTSTTAGDVAHVYALPGTYWVCLTVNDTAGSCSDTYCSSVSSSGTVSCNANFFIVQDTFDLYNYFIYNTSYIASGTMTYFWDFGDGTTSTLPYPSHTYSDTIPVSLCLTITDGASCTSTFCDSILTPGRSGTPFTINVMNPMGISENENTINSLENYPNPFSDNTTINYSINKEANVSISIIDLLGNKIAEIESGNKASGEYSVTWDSQGISDGMYLLQLKVNNDVKTKKIVVNK